MDGAIKFWYHKYQIEWFKKLLKACVKDWRTTDSNSYTLQFTKPNINNHDDLYKLLTKM